METMESTLGELRRQRPRVASRASLGAALVALATLSLGSACVDEETACGDMRRIDGGYCVVAPDAAPNLATDGGSALPDGAGSTDGATDGSTLPSGMGDVCTGSGECTQEADYCAYYAPAGTGYCTISPCTVDPNDCPEGWRCLDGPTMFPGLGIPTMCLTEEDWLAFQGGS